MCIRDSHHTIVRVGVRSADVTDSARPDADLSLVVDCSGSMADGNKMPMTKAALTTLLRSLRPTDKVAIVCYSTTARVLLPPTPASERTASNGPSTRCARSSPRTPRPGSTLSLIHI